MTDDYLWYSLFHEAAHILWHDSDLTFIDGIRGKSADEESGESVAEAEADTWAQDFLIPRTEWDKFADTFEGSAGEVKHFAEEQNISPSIIVGRLQREELLPCNQLNGLKRKLEWPKRPE